MNPAFIALAAIIIAIVCIFLVFRFGKAFFKILMVVFFLLIIGVIIFGAVVVNDAMTFKEGMSEQNNLFVMQSGSNIVSSMVLKPVYKRTGVDLYREQLLNSSNDDSNDLSNLEEQLQNKNIPFTFSSDKQVSDLNDQFKADEFEEMLGSHYKIFFLNESMFAEKSSNVILLGDLDITVGEVLDALKSETVKRTLAEKMAADTSFSVQQVEDKLTETFDDKLRSNLLDYLWKEVVGEEMRDFSIYFDYLKTGEIDVYPNTILFQTIKASPEPIINMVLEKIQGEEE